MSDGFIYLISGTNRPGSRTLQIAKLLESIYQSSGLNVELLSLTDLPLEVFQGTSYASKPAGMVAIQNKVLAATGLHIITPEYNGSFPGVLKYFIDMLKFPESFDRKPVCFTGLSKGMWGAIRSVEQMIQIFGYRNGHVYPERVFMPGIESKYSPAGEFIDADLKGRLQKQVTGFAAFAKNFAK